MGGTWLWPRDLRESLTFWARSLSISQIIIPRLVIPSSGPEYKTQPRNSERKQESPNYYRAYPAFLRPEMLLSGRKHTGRLTFRNIPAVDSPPPPLFFFVPLDHRELNRSNFFFLFCFSFRDMFLSRPLFAATSKRKTLDGAASHQ